MRGHMVAPLPIEMMTASALTMRAISAFVNERGFPDAYLQAAD